MDISIETMLTLPPGAEASMKRKARRRGDKYSSRGNDRPTPGKYERHIQSLRVRLFGFHIFEVRHG